MRVNIYSQEMTSEVVVVKKTRKAPGDNTEHKGVRLMLHSTTMLNDIETDLETDENRSGVTFWLVPYQQKNSILANAFRKIAMFYELNGEEPIS